MEDLTYHHEYFPPGGCTSYNGLNINGEGLPERGSIFRVQVYERVGISLVEVNVRGVKKCKKRVL